MHKRDSLKYKLMSMILVVILVLSIVLSATNILKSRDELKKNIDEKVNYLIGDIVGGLNTELQTHKKLAETVESFYLSTDGSLKKDMYIDILKENVVLNPNTYGMGIWLEPYEYKKEDKFFGPYVYKDGDKVKLTLDYESEDYNYPSYDWYKLGEASIGNNNIAWTSPYYDESRDIYMITASRPIVKNNKFIGNVTADYDVTMIQDLIQEVKVEDTGYAVLTAMNGEVVASPRGTEDMGKNLGEIEAYKDIIKNINKDKINRDLVEIDGSKQVIYSSYIPETDWLIFINIPTAEIYSSVYSMLYTSILILVVSVIISMLLIYKYIDKSLLDPLLGLSNVIEDFGQGDFTKNIEEDILARKDELGIIAAGLNNMKISLVALIENIVDQADIMDGVVENVGENIDGFDTNLENIFADTEELASLTEETSASTEEISAVLENIYELTGSMSEDAERGNSLSEDIRARAYEVKEEIGEMRANGVEVLKENTSNLEQSISDAKVVEEIDALTQSIMQITEQTNLLALNASIEASRAGESGRGFVVIANEVRKLSEQSKESAEGIKATIDRVNSAVSSLINNSSQLLDYVSGDVSESFDVMNNVVIEYEEDSEAINKIVNNFDERSSELEEHMENIKIAIDEVVVAVTNLAEGNTDIASKAELAKINSNTLVEEIDKTIESVERLQEDINNFKL